MNIVIIFLVFVMFEKGKLEKTLQCNNTEIQVYIYVCTGANKKKELNGLVLRRLTDFLYSEL